MVAIMNKVLTFGVYDYFHLGHLRLFKQAKQYGNYLIVALQDNDYILKYKPGSKILYSTNERIEIIKALRIVDEVIIYKYVNENILEQINFDILALGEDQTAQRFQDAADWCHKHNKKVVHLKRTPNIASSKIKEIFR